MRRYICSKNLLQRLLPSNVELLLRAKCSLCYVSSCCYRICVLVKFYLCRFPRCSRRRPGFWWSWPSWRPAGLRQWPCPTCWRTVAGHWGWRPRLRVTLRAAGTGPFFCRGSRKRLSCNIFCECDTNFICLDWLCSSCIGKVYQKILMKKG